MTPATVFVLWVLMNGSNGSIALESHGPFLTDHECESHAVTVKNLMNQPKYAKHVCAPKTIITKGIEDYVNRK